MEEKKLQILSVLVENSAGVLSQVSRMFSRKGFNIDSLAVGPTDNHEISRITILITESDAMTQQISSQLAKLLPVISVQVLPREDSVCRELILVKVRADSREARDEVLQIVSIFRARVVDVSMDSLTIEITGEHSKSEALLKLLDAFGVLELVRTGTVALQRGAATIYEV